ncbi:PKC-activated phosphatase-1 inhibitor [Fasciola gigantica]|uniref:PKC-activated phosphatase-1 inhibitor n=1 Tax=Fasciola gigantica TaxID=46835 RepID=A0A504YL57_FASGI|nr:PKC-activated phosphatase-1 inhibitor [Fasciola gigantica]
MLDQEDIKDAPDGKEENKGVVFLDGQQERKNKKKRYLTAKYDRKTRQKINERIRVENFMFEELRKLYRTEVDDYDCDIDIDELDQLKTMDERSALLKKKLELCPAPESEKNVTFITVFGYRFVQPLTLGYAWEYYYIYISKGQLK